MQRESPYAILGLELAASDAEVRTAYRRRALATHPDKGGTAEACIGATMGLSGTSRRDSISELELERCESPKL